MVRCLCDDCKHNDDGFCEENSWFSPTVDYVSTACGFLPMCTDYKERDPEADEE